MNLLDTPQPAARTLRALARLLSYPTPELRRHLVDIRAALHAEQALPAPRLAELDRLIGKWQRTEGLELEEAYVTLFDRGHATSLHLFEHVHGDSRDRGPAMIDLARSYEMAGLYLAPDEMPDFLPVVLQFASTQPPREARALLAEMVHILNALFNVLDQRQSGYAVILGALLEIAGTRAHPVKVEVDAPLDSTWQEPAAFDGCSVKGQQKPGTPQPIHLVRKSGHLAARAPL